VPLTSIVLALLLQVGPNPLGGAMPGDDLLRDRPPRDEAAPEELNPTSAWLEGCLVQLEEDPARAHTMAQIRRSETSGTDRVLANHCLGMAASALGLWDDARSAFAAALGETPEDETRARSRFAAMAGNAALAGGDAAAAVDLLLQAERDARAAQAASLEAIAATDRARALVRLNRGDEALAALDSAAALAPDAAEVWLLKATLLRRLDRLAEAQTAIERAVTLAPGAEGVGPQVALEAGVIAVLAGRDEAARKSWQSVRDLAPGSAEAATATDYLAQLGDAGETAAATPQKEASQP
jgi:tetratricopeptide (TPR) repeat protein